MPLPHPTYKPSGLSHQSTLCLVISYMNFFSCSLKVEFQTLNNNNKKDQRANAGACYPKREGPLLHPALLFLNVGYSPGSLCFLSTGVCGLRAEGPSCLSSGETCVQNVSSMALIQLPGGWLQNTMMQGGDGDPEEGVSGNGDGILGFGREPQPARPELQVVS